MTVFFSVDVETTGLDPFHPEHQLASVGAVAVTDTGLIVGCWYARLDYHEGGWDPDTKEWWLQQNLLAKDEMFTTDRRPPDAAAVEFYGWMDDMAALDEGDHLDRVFVANPVSFDRAWFQRWWRAARLDVGDAMPADPFSYRTLCLRSADWGRNPGPWGRDRNGHRSRIPHHALHDAHAQALDLLDLL